MHQFQSQNMQTEEAETSHIENVIRAQIDPTGKKITLRQTYDNIDIYYKGLDGRIKIRQTNINVIKQGYDYYKKKK